MIYHFKLNIPPKPLKRAKTTFRGNYIRTYYDKQATEEMEDLRIAILTALKNKDDKIYGEITKHAKTSERIRITLMFVFKLPKSYSNKKKKELMSMPHTLLPDLDNLIKNVLDRADGILFNNDKFIYQITACKVWGEEDLIDLQIQYD